MKDSELVSELQQNDWSVDEAKAAILGFYGTFERFAEEQGMQMKHVKPLIRDQSWSVKRAIAIRKATGGAVNERHLRKELQGVS